jgi:uncharacterized protein
LPLWQLIRASFAAPTFFPPEVVVLRSAPPAGEREFVFVDGGVTIYNNPAFQMFLMATLDRYWALKPDARWQSGADRVLIVSIGTGFSPDARPGLEPKAMNLLFSATTLPSSIRSTASPLCELWENSSPKPGSWRVILKVSCRPKVKGRAH